MPQVAAVQRRNLMAEDKTIDLIDDTDNIKNCIDRQTGKSYEAIISDDGSVHVYDYAPSELKRAVNMHFKSIKEASIPFIFF